MFTRHMVTTFSVWWWVAGWVLSENKAISAFNKDIVEVEAELGKILNFYPLVSTLVISIDTVTSVDTIVMSAGRIFLICIHEMDISFRLE